MSLTEPTLLERLLSKAELTSPRVRMAAYLFAFLVLIGVVLFTFDRCGSWRADREANKHKSNINALASRIKTAEANTKVTETELTVEKDRLKRELEAYRDSGAASEADRINTNNAIDQMEKAKAANYNGVTVDELEELLKRLGQ